MKRTRLDGATLAGRAELADWRVLGDGLCARFSATTFTAAAEFAAGVARLADDADHHPDVDLRFPGLVEIVLTTHDRHGLTEFDADLAGRISALARASAVEADPAAPQSPTVVVATTDPAAAARFWAAVLGHRVRPAAPDGSVTVVDPRRFHPPLRFEPTADRTATARFRLDVAVAADVLTSRLHAAAEAGGHVRADGGPGRPWELADPDGNLVRLHATTAAG
jgi:4a-hydroxytetrahydrobiopterin dehydratase